MLCGKGGERRGAPQGLHQVRPCVEEGDVENSGQETVRISPFGGGEEMSCGKRVAARPVFEAEEIFMKEWRERVRCERDVQQGSFLPRGGYWRAPGPPEWSESNAGTRGGFINGGGSKPGLRKTQAEMPSGRASWNMGCG